MPDEDKTINTNQPITDNPTGPTTPAATTPVGNSGQQTTTPPPMVDGAYSPPPPIVEEAKSEIPSTTPVPETEKATQDIPNIPPVITTSGGGGKKPVGKKMIATILGVLVLVGGIGAGVILVQNQQDIREKAAGGCNGVAVGDYACSGATSCVVCTQTANYDYPTFVSTSLSNCSGLFCGSAPTSAPTSNPTSNPSCIADGRCLGPGESCCSSPSYGSFDNTCYLTEARCGSISTTESACEEAGYTCIHDSADCPAGSGASQSCTTTSSGAPVNRTDDNGYCCKSTSPIWTPNPNCIADGQCLAPGEDCCSSPSYGSFDLTCHVTESRCGSGTPTPTSEPTTKPTLPPGIECSCLTIKTFDDEWNIITNPSSLSVDDTVRFTVSGTTNSGSIDKARFNINGTLMPEVTAKRPSTNEFFYEYIIPEGVSAFTINADLHHTTIGWF